MKTLLKNISFLFILFHSTSFPQFYADSLTPDYVIEFWEIADEFAKQNDPEKGIYKIFTEEEINHIAELYYKCYDENPVGFQKYVNDKHKEWEKTFLEVTSGKIKKRPWLKVYALRYQIANRYGIPFTEVNGTPGFIRAKFDSAYRSSIYLPELKSNWSINNYVFVIEEVLKGNKFFASGDKCTISLSSNAEAPAPVREKDKSYLIPITTWYNTTNYNGEVSFSFLHEDYQTVTDGGIPPKTFPIEDEMIKNIEYFGIQDTSWIDFKKYFKDTYLIFE